MTRSVNWLPYHCLEKYSNTNAHSLTHFPLDGRHDIVYVQAIKCIMVSNIFKVSPQFSYTQQL